MDDIYFAVAWRDDDHLDDDDGGWRQGTYWFAGRGYTYDAFTDGNHRKAGKREVDAELKTADESWPGYSRWVLEHNTDPLGEFFAHQTRKVKERWQFRLSEAIGGVVLADVRRRGTHYLPSRLPAHVKEFLNLDKGCRFLRNFKSGKEAQEAGVPLYKWHTETLDVTVPNKSYIRELRSIAQRHLAREAA